MKKIFLYINFFLLIGVNCHAQEYTLLKTIQVNCKTIEVDPFGNFYTVEENRINKYNQNGKLLYIFNQIDNGTITSLDVSNPLKPIIFYKDFSNLQMLDQKLSLINTINLTERNLDFVATVAHSNGDNFWVYDNLSNTLKKINKSLNLVYESESFLNLFTENLMPLKIIESEQNVFVLNTLGIHLFDNFANFNKTLSVQNLSDFQVLEGKIIYINKEDFVSNNLKTLQTELLKIPDLNEILSAKLFKNGILIQKENQVHIYSIK